MPKFKLELETKFYIIMKNVRMSVFVIFTCMTFAITSCQQAGKNEADAEEETSAEEQLPSPRRQAEGEIEGVTIKVDYGSPARQTIPYFSNSPHTVLPFTAGDP